MNRLLLQCMAAAALLGVSLFANGANEPLLPDALIAQLPNHESWRTFAKPLAMRDGRTLLFQRDLNQAVVWQIEWKNKKVHSFPLSGFPLEDKGRYTALASRDGLWLLGKASVLIRPDGQRLSIETGFNEPVAVVLDDQSVLVLGPALHGAADQDSQLRMLQLRVVEGGKRLQLIDRGVLSYDGRPNENGQRYRSPRYGHNAVKLRDGRVMMFGGDVTPTLVSVIEPRADAGPWVPKPLSEMPNERVFGVAQVFPDGRVAITGAPHLNCYGEAAKVRSVDVYDPSSNRWSSLPPLPFVPCADAYGSDTPSMAMTPNGSLLVGGHLEPQVMVLPRDAKSATGFADSWQTHGRMPLRRIGGVVQALSDGEVIVAGGVDNPKKEFGGCCYATAAVDRISITGGESDRSLAMGYVGVGVARRGQWVFAASGRRFGFTGSGQMRYSAHAELIDLVTGKVRQLPNMPFASGAARAFWMDDERILVQGIKAAGGDGFTPGAGLSSYIPPSSSAMAIFNLKENRWSKPIDMPELADARLIAAERDMALLLAPTKVIRLNLDTLKQEVLRSVQSLGGDAEVRFLPQGKLALAGSGLVRTDLVSVLDTECEALPENACEERFEGFGPFTSHTVLEVASLSDPTAVSTLSANGPEHILSTVVTAQARAMVLVRDEKADRVYLTISSQNGKSWDGMPMPRGLTSMASCGDCALVRAPDPRAPNQELIFFRRGAVNADYIDDAIEKQSLGVWWWNGTKGQWIKVLESSGLAARSSPLMLEVPLSPARGKRMMSMGWHLREPVLWMEP